jgi:hypothetical protein
LHGRQLLPVLAALSLPFSPGHYEGSSGLPPDELVPVEARILAPTVPEAVVAWDPRLGTKPSPLERPDWSDPVALLLVSLALALRFALGAAAATRSVRIHGTGERGIPFRRGPPEPLLAPAG